MKQRQYSMDIPKSALDQMQVAHPDKLMMTVNHNRLIIESADLAERTPNIPVWSYLVPGIASVIVFLSYCHFLHVPTMPLVGANSIASCITILSVAFGLIAFATTFIWEKVHKTGPASDFYWRSLLPLIVAIGAIAVFSFLALFWLIGQMFEGARFDDFTASVMVLTVVAVNAYLSIYLAKELSPSALTDLMMCMILGGMIFSMVTNSDSNWWRHNFSFLGTTKNAGNLQFNITLIFSGLIMITLTDYLFVTIQKRMPGFGTQVVRWLLYGEAACIAGIGLFPNNARYHHFHDSISMWLVYFMLILIVALHWLMPQIPKRFLRISYVLGSLMGFDYIVFETTYYLSLTAFELLEFFLAFTWLLLFFQYLQVMASLGRNIFSVAIVKQSPLSTQSQSSEDGTPPQS